MKTRSFCIYSSRIGNAARTILGQQRKEQKKEGATTNGRKYRSGPLQSSHFHLKRWLLGSQGVKPETRLLFQVLTFVATLACFVLNVVRMCFSLLQ